MEGYTSTRGPTLSNPSLGNPEPDGLVKITVITTVGIKEVKIDSSLSVNLGTRNLSSRTNFIPERMVVLYLACLVD